VRQAELPGNSCDRDPSLEGSTYGIEFSLGQCRRSKSDLPRPRPLWLWLVQTHGLARWAWLKARQWSATTLGLVDCRRKKAVQFSVVEIFD